MPRFVNVIAMIQSANRQIGGADRDRTGGLLVANQALSQLSYSPLTAVASFQLPVASRTYWELAAGNWLLILVGLGRVELPTSPLSGVRSSHLSYRPGLPRNFPKRASIISSRLLATSF